MVRVCSLLVLVALLAAAAPAWAAEPPALAKARALYNLGDYGAAIESASAARSVPEFADAAALVIARARLERFRLQSDQVDLTIARETLGTVRAEKLSPRDRLDLLIGLGQTLFFADSFGAAAEIFESATHSSAMLSERDRVQLLDWWATALDREAQTRAPDARPRLYSRIVARMEDELEVAPGSEVANFWLPAALRGEGNLDRAWDAVIAGWVRASMARETLPSLRGDLDRLVTEALIPERVRGRTDQQDAAKALRAEWEAVKENWK